jgi:hypothetical protein
MRNKKERRKIDLAPFFGKICLNSKKLFEILIKVAIFEALESFYTIFNGRVVYQK